MLGKRTKILSELLRDKEISKRLDSGTHAFVISDELDLFASRECVSEILQQKISSDVQSVMFESRKDIKKFTGEALASERRTLEKCSGSFFMPDGGKKGGYILYIRKLYKYTLGINMLPLLRVILARTISQQEIRFYSLKKAGSIFSDEKKSNHCKSSISGYEELNKNQNIDILPVDKKCTGKLSDTKNLRKLPTSYPQKLGHSTGIKNEIERVLQQWNKIRRLFHFSDEPPISAARLPRGEFADQRYRVLRQRFKDPAWIEALSDFMVLLELHPEFIRNKTFTQLITYNENVFTWRATLRDKEHARTNTPSYRQHQRKEEYERLIAEAKRRHTLRSALPEALEENIS